MARDFHPVGKKKCYACLQWAGERTYYPKDGKFMVDPGDRGRCLIWHQDRTGDQTCEHFEPVK